MWSEKTRNIARAKIDTHFNSKPAKKRTVHAPVPVPAKPGAFSFCAAALSLVKDPNAPRWIELHEMAAREGYAQQDVVSYLKSAAEAVHGLH